ncbi:MAG: sulfite exporter TauE/SafE family protein [Dehalococcoidia bacterium]
MFPVSPFEAIGVCAIVAVGACIQGSIGFGWAMLSAPFIVLIEPDFVPAPAILAGIVLVILMTWRERKSIDKRGVQWMAGGCVPGIVGASAILLVISATGFTITFSVLVLLAVALSAAGISVVLSNRNLLMAGLLSGFMGTMSSIGGPPVALIYQHSPGAKLRGTLSAFFLISASLALIGLFLVGKLGTNELKLALVLIPGLLAGYYISRFTIKILDRYSLRPAVLILSAMAAIAVLVRALV